MATNIRNDSANNIRAFSGINNVDAHSTLQNGELTRGINIDIDAKGKITRRQGYTKRYNGTNIHSLWSNESITLFVEDGTLKQLNSDYSADSIRTGVSRFGKVYYEDINGDVYYSDGKVTGVVKTDGSHAPMSTPIPTTRPVLTSTTGVLPAGRYGVVFTAVDSLGRESGATFSTYIDLADVGGINVQGLPVSHGESVTHYNIYCTTANGAVFYLSSAVATGATYYEINTLPSTGHALRTQFMDMMPAGTHLCQHGGRLFVAKDNVLYFSQPFQYGLTNLFTDFIMMPSRILMVISVEDSLYISDESNIYLLTGTDINQSQMQMKAHYPAIEGTAVKLDQRVFGADGQNGLVAMWMSEAGLCAGLQGGSFRNLTETKYVPRVGDLANAMFRQQDGKNQYIGVSRTRDGEQNRIYTSDVAVAEVIRNGVILT